MINLIECQFDHSQNDMSELWSGVAYFRFLLIFIPCFIH